MVNKTKYIWCGAIVVLVLTVFAFVLRLIVEPLLFERPELALAKQFMSTNPALAEAVGEISEVTPDKGNSSVSILSDGTRGFYDFHVVGENASVDARLEWECYTTSGQTNFHGTVVRILHGVRQAEKIWP